MEMKEAAQEARLLVKIFSWIQIKQYEALFFRSRFLLSFSEFGEVHRDQSFRLHHGDGFDIDRSEFSENLLMSAFPID